MSESNPYTPPETPVAPDASRDWQIDGNGLLIKDGATLPKVDIETGESDDSMEKTKLGIDFSTFGIVRNSIFLIVVIAVSRAVSNPLVVLALSVGAIAGSRVLNKIRWPKSGTSINEFVGPTRRGGQFARRKHRLTCRLSLGIIVAGSILMLARSPEHQVLMFGILAGDLLIAGALAFWASRERSVIKIEAAQPGWVRVSPVHPDALAYFRKLADPPVVRKPPALVPARGQLGKPAPPEP